MKAEALNEAIAMIPKATMAVETEKGLSKATGFIIREVDGKPVIILKIRK